MIQIAKPAISEDAMDRVRTVLESGMLADGPEVRAFEDEFSAFCGTEYGIATSNGTTALEATLRAFDIGRGDRVLTTPFSFVATANAIRLAGAEPVFSDVDPQTFNLDPEAAEAVAREADVDAILTVHLYGLPSEMDALADLAADLDVPLIEDAAQAHGAEYRGERVGSLGDAACFSFYPTKNMTTGEGGMVTTDRDDVDERVRSFINHGRDVGADGDGGGTYDHVRLGTNDRMTSVAAAIGRTQLERLDEFTAARRENAARLTDGLAKNEGIETPIEPAQMKHVYHQYTIRTEDREGLMAHLADHDVGSSVYYPTPIHEQPAFDGVTTSAPAAESAATEVLSLPVHPAITYSEVDTIVEVTNAHGE